MRNIKLVMWGLLILPILSVGFIGKKYFFRFLPSATFVSLLLALMSEIADSRKWWKVKINIIPDLKTNVSFILGSFFVGTLWVFKYSYGKFLRYIGINAVLDWFFAYPFTYLFQKMGVYKLIRFKQHQIFLTFLSYSVIIYWFQKMIEKYILKTKEEEELMQETL